MQRRAMECGVLASLLRYGTGPSRGVIWHWLLMVHDNVVSCLSVWHCKEQHHFGHRRIVVNPLVLSVQSLS
jgi:hypothetical protein